MTGGGCVCCPEFSRNCIHDTPSSFSSRRGGGSKFIARNVSVRGGMTESFRFLSRDWNFSLLSSL